MSARSVRSASSIGAPAGMVGVVYAILLSKAAVFALIFLAHSLLPMNGEYFLDHFNYPFDPGTLASSYDTWDASHYLWLADHGYLSGDPSDAFYPLFPLLIHLVSFAVRNTFVAGLLVANICSLAGAYLFYRLSVAVLRDEGLAMVALLVLLAFPTAFFLSLIFSEALFLALACGVFVALMQRRMTLAAVLAFLIALTRPVGVLMVIPLLAASVRWERGRGPRPTRSLWVVAGPALGFAVYLGIMYLATGDAMQGFDAQSQFGPLPLGVSGLLHPAELAQRWFGGPFSVHGFRDSIIDRVFFAGFLLSLPAIWRLRNPPLFWYSVALGLVPLVGSFMSYTRYVLPVFPLYMAVAHVLGQERWRFLLFPWLFASIMLQALFVVMECLGYWVA